MKISGITHVMVAQSSSDNPRNDTANVVELNDGSLMLVWHKFGVSANGGGDFGISRIYSKSSYDGGLTWVNERMLVDVEEGDVNVQAPSLCLLPTGELLLTCLRAHGHDSSTMVQFRSDDGGVSFREHIKIWERSSGQWLQGGAASLVRLSDGRLLLPFHGGTGRQENQHNIAGCYISDDDGESWRMSRGIVDLPMRGAMEASIAELKDRSLAMSLRTQLGSVFLSRSYDGGETWTLAQTTGLKSGESCTCLRTMPDGNNLLLVWNDSEYTPGHHHYGERTPLSLAVSPDGGNFWNRLGNIDEGDFEYTNLNCTFLSNGAAVITYMKVKYMKDKPFIRTGMDLHAAIIKFEK